MFCCFFFHLALLHFIYYFIQADGNLSPCQLDRNIHRFIFYIETNMLHVLFLTWLKMENVQTKNKLSRYFQGRVAISRATSSKGLLIINFHEGTTSVVKDFMTTVPSCQPLNDLSCCRKQQR